jgi:hypothetical protein
MAQFERGINGNPAGRPPGIRDKRQAMRDKLVSHADELISKVVELAKEGDTAALRVCIERLIPPAKAKDDPVELPELAQRDALADCGQAVMTALAEGRITPDEAATIMGALSGQARIVETSEIDRRLRVLEEAAAAKKGTKA